MNKVLDPACAGVSGTRSRAYLVSVVPHLALACWCATAKDSSCGELTGMHERARYIHLLAPIRLFGRSRKFRLALGAACIIVACFAATLWALNRYIPTDSGLPEALAILQPPHALQPVTRASYVIAPVAVALTAIGQTLDAAAPREFAGKNDNPVTQLLGQAEIGLTSHAAR